jgi:Phosphodiester glycosidase
VPSARVEPIPFWRRARRILLLAAIACLVPTGISYLGAMTEKHNVGLGVSSVEWLRQNGGNSLVSEVENWYYSLTAPEKGGSPLRSLPQVGIAGGAAPDRAYRPPRIAPLIHPALPGEGIWKPAGAAAGARPPVLLTTFRSDPEYPRFVAGVAWIDSTRTRLEYVPGLAEPPEPLPHRGPGEVPTSARGRLVATFNGGFPLETSNAGLIYRGRVVETMVNGIATIVGYRDGRVDVVRWHRGASVPANVWFAKQNLPPIIYEGHLNPHLSDGPEWGETVNNAVRVWRSGLGIDRRGNLIYAAANYQTVESLAKILQRAGAVRALELDINEDWTSFISYRHPGALEPSNLLPEMFRSPERYLAPDERDFFSVHLRGGQGW